MPHYQTKDKPPLCGQPLTPSEENIHKKLISDLSKPQISKKLRVSVRAVRFHSVNIYAKKGVKNRYGLIMDHYEKKLKQLNQ